MGTGESPSPFARLLRHYRQAAGLTREELGQRAHLTGRAIGELERGLKQPPRPDTVAVLAEALALAPAERAAFEAAACPPVPATEEREVPIGAGATLPTGMLTFLIADVRGYTAYTHRHGDEAGARLATRFATVAGEAVASVLGQEWDLDLLLGAVEADEAAVLDHLEAAPRAQGLVERALVAMSRSALR